MQPLTLADKIKIFFSDVEEAWAAVPGYIKVFLYSTATMLFAAWVSGDLSFREIIISIAFNLGIYQIPRTIGSETKKLL